MADTNSSQGQGLAAASDDTKKQGSDQGQQNNPGNFANRPTDDVKRSAQKGGES